MLNGAITQISATQMQQGLGDWGQSTSDTGTSSRPANAKKGEDGIMSHAPLS